MKMLKLVPIGAALLALGMGLSSAVPHRAMAADRTLIVDECQRTSEMRILITHGTDTMVDTARALGEALRPSAGKTVVLTGAMVPYAFGSSDGLFNLGSALSFVQALPAGVYVAMNGRCFSWDGVWKNRQTGVFESI